MLKLPLSFTNCVLCYVYDDPRYFTWVQTINRSRGTMKAFLYLLNNALTLCRLCYIKRPPIKYQDQLDYFDLSHDIPGSLSA